MENSTLKTKLCTAGVIEVSPEELDQAENLMTDINSQPRPKSYNPLKDEDLQN